MEKRLLEVLQQAYNNSVYYNNLFKNCGFDFNNPDIEKYVEIPILTREQIFSNTQDILHKDCHYINRKSLLVERTSGSTGHFVEVYWKNNEYFASNMCLWRKRKKWYGITPDDKICTFFTTGAASEKIVLRKKRMEFSSIHMSENDVENYIKQIHLFKPKWLMLSPSIALILLDACRNKSLSLPDSVKYIELFGENVSPAAYETVVNFFKIPTSIMYGAKEVNGIALTCPYGHMHILEDNNYLEIIDQGKVLITNLHNTYFPIIRYEIGDKAEIKEVNCPCGESGYVVDKIYGKSNYLKYLDKQTGLTTSMLKSVIDDVDAVFDYPIIQFQIQYKDNSVIIHLYCKNEYGKWENEITNEFTHKVQQYAVNNIKINTVFHESPLPYNQTIGKLPIMIKN